MCTARISLNVFSFVQTYFALLMLQSVIMFSGEKKEELEEKNMRNILNTLFN